MRILLRVFREILYGILGAICFILIPTILVGPLFSIAYLVDTYDKWFVILFPLYFGGMWFLLRLSDRYLIPSLPMLDEEDSEEDS